MVEKRVGSLDASGELVSLIRLPIAALTSLIWLIPRAAARFRLACAVQLSDDDTLLVTSSRPSSLKFCAFHASVRSVLNLSFFFNFTQITPPESIYCQCTNQARAVSGTVGAS